MQWYSWERLVFRMPKYWADQQVSLGPGHLFTEVQGGEEAAQVLVPSQASRLLVLASSLWQGLWVLCPLCSPRLCLPQATYVLLALAWVFVPIYISSEVSLLLGPQSSLTWAWALVRVGGGDRQDPLASLTSWGTLRTGICC